MAKRPVHTGVLSAFVGSVAMAALIMARGTLGLAPEVSTLRALNAIMSTPATSAAGWFAFFVIFTLLWGVVYGLVEAKLPGRSAAAHGFVFALGTWLVTMLLLMPWAGFGFFAASADPVAAVLSLVLHLVYGLVLGGYGWLVHRQSAPTADAWPGGPDH